MDYIGSERFVEFKFAEILNINFPTILAEVHEKRINSFFGGSRLLLQVGSEKNGKEGVTAADEM